jgi:hypothetical protein
MGMAAELSLGILFGDFLLRLLLAGALAILLPLDRRERAQF